MRTRYAWLLVLTSAIGLSAAGTGVSLVDAVKAGNRDTVRALIRQRASINAAEPDAVGPDGETVLMSAARGGNPDAVRALITRGASVNATEGWQGQTALMWAAAENHAAAVKVLIEHGADANIRSKELAFPDYRYETNGMAVFQLP